MLDGHFLSKRFLGDTHFVMSLIVFGIVLVSASDLCSGVLLSQSREVRLSAVFKSNEYGRAH